MAFGAWIFYIALDQDVTPVKTQGKVPSHEAFADKKDTDVAIKMHEFDVLRTIKLVGIFIDRTLKEESQAKIQLVLGQPTVVTFKQGDHLVSHWFLAKIYEQSIIIHNDLILEDRFISLDADSASKSSSTFSDPRLNFAQKPRPNLNKPDIVDEATWADMKSNYGL